MKRLVGVLLLLLTGCGNKENMKTLDVTINTDYGFPNLSWTALEEKDVEYQISLYGGTQKFCTVTQNETAFHGKDYVAYYAQENDYYGDMKFEVSAYSDKREIAHGESEVFAAEEFFPKETELAVSEFMLDGLESFSYTGSGDSAEMNFSYSLILEEDQLLISADYYDEENERIQVDKEAAKALLEELKPYLRNGILKRRYVMDPEIHMLDGSESSFDMRWKDMTRNERTWYRFVPEDQDELIRWLRSVCK